MREQAAQVQEAGGSAYVIDFESDEREQSEHFQNLFDRSSDYDQWTGLAELSAIVESTAESNP